MTWVIRDESRRGKTGKPVVSWWYGPKHGWGRTFGEPREAGAFKTRKEAEIAFRNEFGVRVAWKPQRLVDAIAEKDARTAAYEERVTITDEVKK